jgi:hypothetical protein
MDEEKRAKVKGVVFFTKQDQQNLMSRGYVYVAYGQVEVDEKTYGLEAEAVGLMARMLFEEHGLKVEWNGDPSTRLKVVVDER